METIDSLLAARVRAWCAKHVAPDDRLFPPRIYDDDEREISELVGKLVEARMRESGAWKRHDWSDGVTSMAIARIDAETIEVTGLLVWNSEQWVDPVFARLASSTGETPLAYAIKFGDAATGLAQYKYGARRAAPSPQQWLFELHDDASTG